MGENAPKTRLASPTPGSGEGCSSRTVRVTKVSDPEGRENTARALAMKGRSGTPAPSVAGRHPWRRPGAAAEDPDSRCPWRPRPAGSGGGASGAGSLTGSWPSSQHECPYTVLNVWATWIWPFNPQALSAVGVCQTWVSTHTIFFLLEGAAPRGAAGAHTTFSVK